MKSSSRILILVVLIVVVVGVVTFINRRKISHIISHFAINNFTIRTFQKAVIVCTSKGSQRVDKTDVWTFRRFDWTYATVVRYVYVTYFEACTLTRKTTRT